MSGIAKESSLDFVCEEELKENFTVLCDEANITFSDAVRGLIDKCVSLGKLPNEMVNALLAEYLQLNKAATDCGYKTDGQFAEGAVRCHIRINSETKAKFVSILKNDPSRLKANKAIRLYMRMCINEKNLFY